MSVKTRQTCEEQNVNADSEISSEDSDINAENWRGHENEINRIFSLYKDKVNGTVAVYNSVTGEFPLGVLNEIRDIFGHMTQSLMSCDSEKTSQYLNEACGHCKRAAVDGFKYAASAYLKIYDAFMETYKNVDLSYIDNGEFLPRLTRLYAEAGQRMTKARLIEAAVHTDDLMYEVYEDAFNCYAQLYKCVMEAMEPAEGLRMRAEKDEIAIKEKEHKNTNINKASIALGVVGLIVGIAGVVVNFL